MMKRFDRSTWVLLASSCLLCLILFLVGWWSRQSAFDVPALLGKDIDTVIATVGPPVRDTELSDKNANFWHAKTWQNGNYELTVAFNKNTRRVIDFEIGCPAPTMHRSDKTHLLKLANIKEDDSRFRFLVHPVDTDINQCLLVQAIPK